MIIINMIIMMIIIIIVIVIIIIIIIIIITIALQHVDRGEAQTMMMLTARRRHRQ